MTLRLVIDPGHGGEADGAVVEGVREDELALELAKELALSLQGLPVEVALTRHEDTAMSLHQRAELARDFGAHLVVSIHLNAGTTQRGADVFVMPPPLGTLDAARVAEVVARAMPAKLFSGRVHSTAALPHWTGRAHNVLEPHQRIHGAPAVLVECGYLTAAADRAYISTRWGRASVVSALRAGVCRFGEMRSAAA